METWAEAIKHVEGGWPRYRLVFLCVNIISRGQGGCAALGRSNHYLFGKFCSQVPRYVDTRDIGGAFLIRYRVAGAVKFYPGRHNLVVWQKADKDKNSFRCDGSVGSRSAGLLRQSNEPRLH